MLLYLQEPTLRDGIAMTIEGSAQSCYSNAPKNYVMLESIVDSYELVWEGITYVNAEFP